MLPQFGGVGRLNTEEGIPNCARSHGSGGEENVVIKLDVGIAPTDVVGAGSEITATEVSAVGEGKEPSAVMRPVRTRQNISFEPIVDAGNRKDFMGDTQQGCQQTQNKQDRQEEGREERAWPLISTLTTEPLSRSDTNFQTNDINFRPNCTKSMQAVCMCTTLPISQAALYPPVDTQTRCMPQTDKARQVTAQAKFTYSREPVKRGMRNME